MGEGKENKYMIWQLGTIVIIAFLILLIMLLVFTL